MPLPDDADMVMHGQVLPEDAYGTKFVIRDRLAQIVQVSSAFGSLMSDLLVSRPDLAYAVGAFAVGVVSRLVADIVHCVGFFGRDFMYSRTSNDVACMPSTSFTTTTSQLVVKNDICQCVHPIVQLCLAIHV